MQRGGLWLSRGWRGGDGRQANLEDLDDLNRTRAAVATEYRRAERLGNQRHHLQTINAIHPDKRRAARMSTDERRAVHTVHMRRDSPVSTHALLMIEVA